MHARTVRPSRARRLVRRGLVAGIASAAAFAVAAPPAGAIPPGGAVDRPNGAKVRLDRKAVKAGGKIRVTGRNWKAKGSRIQRGARVTVKLDDLHIVAVLPIRHKRFAGWVTIPRQVQPGRHWLRFLAAKPATSVKSARFRVTRR